MAKLRIILLFIDYDIRFFEELEGFLWITGIFSLFLSFQVKSVNFPKNKEAGNKFPALKSI